MWGPNAALSFAYDGKGAKRLLLGPYCQMGYSVCFVKFSAGERVPIPLHDIVGTLTRHGCKFSALREGRNAVVLPHDANHHSFIGDSATLSVQDGAASEFDIDRPQCTTECKALFYSLIQELGLMMFPDFGRIMYARNDTFQNVPKSILDQFTELIVVTEPDDCCS